MLINTSGSRRGFTIVELLIVIVVIAILAAISIVAYNGIQSRANDAAVQSDLANFLKKAKIYQADMNQYQRTDSEIEALEVRISKGSYDTNYNNLVHCSTRNNPPGIGLEFAIIGKSKSGNAFYVSSRGSGSFTLAGNAVMPSEACGLIDLVSGAGATPDQGQSSVGYNVSTGVWKTWAG